MSDRYSASANPDYRGVLQRDIVPLLSIGTPLIIHNLALMGMQFTDTLMSGRLGADTLAAVAVGVNVWSPVFLFILGVLMGLSPTAAQLFGAGRNREIGRYVRQMFWLSQLLAWLGVLLLRHTSGLMHLVGIKAELAQLSAAYLQAMAWGLPAISLYQVLRFTSEAISHTRPMLFIALLGLGFNVLADYALMYGKLGLPAMGAVGCGYASALTMWLMMLVMLIYVIRQRRFRSLEIFVRFDWPFRSVQQEMLILGVPIAIGVFMEVSLFSAVALIMGGLGTDIVAAHQIAINYAAIMFMIPMSLSLAISVRVGQAIGRSDYQAARRAGMVGIVMSLGFELVSALVLVLIPDDIAGLYTSDINVRHIAIGLLYMAAIFQLSDGLQVSTAGALRGYKDTGIPMVITIVAYWLVGFPLAWVFGIWLRLGAQGVWAGLIGGLSFAAVLLSFRLMHVQRAADVT